MNHLDELTLLRMADGELIEERAEATRDHLLSCARCQASYEVLKAETEVFRAALREQEEELPDSIRPGVDLSWFMVAAAAASVLGIAAFWNRVVEPAFRSMESVGLDGTSVVTSVLIRSVLWRGWSEMATTVFQGVVALVVISTAGSVLLWGWRRRRSTTAIVCLAVVTGVGLGPRGASAAVIELERDSYVLRDGERIDNDLVVAGGRVLIEGVVTGDLIVATRFLEVTGEVQGDILGLAEEIDVTGTVGGNVRTASRSLAIEGTVSRNVTAAGETIRVRPGASIQGSFTSASREVLLSGPVQRDLLAAAQIHELNGRLGGSALLAGERLRIGPEAGVEGEVTFYGAEEPEVSSQAELASPVTFEYVEPDHEPTTPVGWVADLIYFWAAAFVLGAALILVGPEASETLRAVHLPDYGKSLLVGLLSLFAVPAIALFLCVTLVGLPLGLLLLSVLGFGVYAAQAYVGVYLGSEILGAPADTSQRLGRLALGLLVIQFGKAVPILGTLVTLAVAVWGLGALTLWALDRAPWAGGTPLPAPAEARA